MKNNKKNEKKSAKKKRKNEPIILKNIKNERKLFKEDAYIILTEKEVQLLDLFLNKNKPISKDDILSSVWNYSSEADTHTVETHIYRLRQKIGRLTKTPIVITAENGYRLEL